MGLAGEEQAGWSTAPHLQAQGQGAEPVSMSPLGAQLPEVRRREEKQIWKQDPAEHGYVILHCKWSNRWSGQDFAPSADF